MDAPISRDAICRLWPVFENSIRHRLLTGASTYGDSSFSRSDIELLDEVAQELFDVVGWAFILWCKIDNLKKRCMNEGGL